MRDRFGLARFVAAQEPVFAQVLSELETGRKRSHWIWFVFPQVAGLGSSPMAERFAIRSLAEAEAYMAHPILGPRLTRCAALVNAVVGRTAHEIFGSPDDMKFRSSMTLFTRAAPEPAPFQHALDLYYGGEPDAATLRLIAR